MLLNYEILGSTVIPSGSLKRSLNLCASVSSCTKDTFKGLWENQQILKYYFKHKHKQLWSAREVSLNTILEEGAGIKFILPVFMSGFKSLRHSMLNNSCENYSFGSKGQTRWDTCNCQQQHDGILLPPHSTLQYLVMCMSCCDIMTFRVFSPLLSNDMEGCVVGTTLPWKLAG